MLVLSKVVVVVESYIHTWTRVWRHAIEATGGGWVLASARVRQTSTSTSPLLGVSVVVRERKAATVKESCESQEKRLARLRACALLLLLYRTTSGYVSSETRRVWFSSLFGFLAANSLSLSLSRARSQLKHFAEVFIHPCTPPRGLTHACSVFSKLPPPRVDHVQQNVTCSAFRTPAKPLSTLSEQTNPTTLSDNHPRGGAKPSWRSKTADTEHFLRQEGSTDRRTDGQTDGRWLCDPVRLLTRNRIGRTRAPSSSSSCASACLLLPSRARPQARQFPRLPHPPPCPLRQYRRRRPLWRPTFSSFSWKLPWRERRRRPRRPVRRRYCWRIPAAAAAAASPAVSASSSRVGSETRKKRIVCDQTKAARTRRPKGCSTS